jgi:O-antigen/teichoic acid export membrane protein
VVTAGGISVVRSASLTLATRALLFVLALATNVVLARILGPNGRGIYAIAVLIPSILTLLATFGFGPASVYHVSRGSVDKAHLVATSLTIALGVGVAIYGAFILVVIISGSRTVLGIEVRYIEVSAISLPFTLMSAFMQGVLHGERRFVVLNAVWVTQAATLMVLLLMLLLLPLDRLIYSITAWTTSAVVSGLVAVVLVAQQTRIGLGIHLPTLKAMLRYGSLTYLGTLASFVNYRFDLLLVNAFSGPTQAGLYAVGAGLAEVVWFLPNSLTIALAPRVAAGTESESSTLSAQATRSVLAVTIFMSLVLAALAPLIITIFFGADFGPSAVAVWLLLPGIVTFSAWKIMSCYLLGRNLLRQDLGAATAAMVFTLVLDVALIPAYGFRGAAIASSIAYSIAMLVDLYWALRRSGLTARVWLIAVPSDSYPVVSRLRALRLRASDLRGE